MYHLTENDSFPFVKDAAERHIRLCHQNKGGDKYATLIQGVVDNLSTKLTVRDTARKAVSSAGDTAWLADRMLDDVIRKFQGRAKEYDLANPGSNTLNLVLPEGNITSLINEPLEEEPTKANAVALKIKSLGETHTLYPLAAEIESAVTVCNEKLKIRNEAEKAFSEATAIAEIAKAAVVEQYNNTYHKAASEVDKNYAEKLFPRLRPKTKKEEEEDINSK